MRPQRKPKSTNECGQRLDALATEFPTALDRTMRPGLLAAAVLVIGSARGLGLLAIAGFAALTLGLVLLRRFRFGHTGSLAWTGRARRGVLPLTRRHAVHVRDPQR